MLPERGPVMGDVVSLQHLIKEVLREKGMLSTNGNMDTNSSNIRNLYRTFERFVKALGGDTSLLKDNSNGKNKRYVIDKGDAAFVKLILVQLNEKNDLFEIILKDHKRSKSFSSKDVNEFIFTLFDAADNETDDRKKTEIAEVANFCCKVFLQSPLRSLEKCHAVIDTIWSTVQDMTYEEQSRYLSEIADMLESELHRSHTESVINIRDTAEMAISCNLSNGATPYDGYPSDIQNDYLQRDRNILARIQQDEELRNYIESTFRKKAEDIFGYTAI